MSSTFIGHESQYDPTTGVVVSTLKSTAGGPGIGQSLKNFSGTVNIATGATVALETVTPGKTFYITDITIYANTGVVFTVAINAAGVAVFSAFCKGDTGPVQVAGIESQPSASSTQAVTLVLGAAASTTAAYNICGFEQ
ncbi:MAG: hypothetical protein NVSMB4_00650 [Acidimicrobiales bacterium]